MLTSSPKTLCDLKHARMVNLLLYMMFLSIILLPSVGLASGTPEQSLNIMCRIVGVTVNGPIGAGIASLGIVIISVSAILGRMSWSAAAAIVGGIAIIMGAGAIAEQLGAIRECAASEMA